VGNVAGVRVFSGDGRPPVGRSGGVRRPAPSAGRSVDTPVWGGLNEAGFGTDQECLVPTRTGVSPTLTGATPTDLAPVPTRIGAGQHNHQFGGIWFITGIV
jgi:hypothetical protein